MCWSTQRILLVTYVPKKKKIESKSIALTILESFFFGLNPKAKSKSQQEDDRSIPDSGVTVNQIKNPQEGKIKKMLEKKTPKS